MKSSLTLVVASFGNHIKLCAEGHLHLRHDRISKRYVIHKSGYAIFRETTSDDVTGKPVVLVVGFRLRLIRSNHVAHWLFQQLCTLTTPFWSGMLGLMRNNMCITYCLF